MKTTQQKLEAIREACISVNKSITDLVSGCAFTWNHDFWRINCSRCEDDRIFAFSCTGDKHSFPPEIFSKEDKWEYKYKSFNKSEFESDYFEIIGRDIQLADVLLALQNTNIKVAFYGNNKLWFVFRKTQNGRLNVAWNLLLPLHLQEESTISFIYELIK
jgi:hypothetical protein